MVPSLPAAPNLEQLKKRARGPLRAHQAGDASCCNVLRTLNRFANSDDAEILAARIPLKQVQFALAMDYGFPSWAELKAHITDPVDLASRVQRDGSKVSLDGLRSVRRWTSHIGAIEACIRYLGSTDSTAWLYGASGHAFFISGRGNLEDYHFWYPRPMLQAVSHIGYDIDCVWAWADDDGFADDQALAWEKITTAMNRGHPCYGFGIVMPPQCQLIVAHDDAGYFSENEPDRCAPWQEVNGLPGDLTMCTVSPGRRSPDRVTVASAIHLALEGVGNYPGGWGVVVYDNWLANIADGSFNPYQVAPFISRIWAECRQYAAEFLIEARQRLAADVRPETFDDAIGHYRAVAEAWREITDLCPQGQTPPDDQTVRSISAEVARQLEAAKAAETAGLSALGELLTVIE